MDLNDLLRQIRERPDDDAPRLAFADAVEAGDPERAEFIRLQLQSHAMPPMHPGRGDVDRRANQILWRRWAHWMDGRPTGSGVAWLPERGFPDVVRFDSYTAFQKYHRPVLALSPRRVVVSGWRDPMRLAASPALAQIRELRIALGADAVLESPHLGPLTRLEVEGATPSEEGLRALAARPELSGLRYLAISGYYGQQGVSAAGVEALAASPHLRGLEELHLRRCALDDAAARALLASPNLARLTRLDLTNNRISADGLRGAALPALRVLRLGENRLGDGGAAAAGRLGRLRELTLDGNRVGSAGAAALAAAANLADLEWLSLHGNVIDDGGAEALAASRSLRSLVGLNVVKNLIDERGMLALGQSRTLGRLTYFLADANPARGALTAAVVERFKSHGPPLKDAPAAPAPSPAAEVAPVGPADEDGLVRALVADPDDCATRLIYADWLEDHGAADLAELMRLEGAPPEAGEGQVRHQQLRDRVKAAILGGFPRYAQQVHYERGLPVAWVQLRGVLTKAFDAAAEGWLKSHHVHGLHVNGSAADWARLAGVSAFARLRALSVSGMRFGDAGAAGLAGSPHLDGLFALDVQSNHVGEAGLRALFAPGKLPRLVALNLSYNRPLVDGLRAVVESACASGLARLDLRYTHPTAAGVAVLAGAARLGQLLALDLSGCWLDDAALEALARSPHLGRLRDLTLSRNRFTAFGFDALASSALLSRLRWLALDYNQPDADALRRLVRAVPAGCRLRLSRYSTPAEVQAEADAALGGRVTWV